MLRALSDGHNGLGSKVAHITNVLYKEQAAAAFAHCNAAAFQWDASNYQGLSVNIGLAWNLHTGVAANLLPQVAGEKTNLFFCGQVACPSLGWSPGGPEKTQFVSILVGKYTCNPPNACMFWLSSLKKLKKSQNDSN